MHPTQSQEIKEHKEPEVINHVSPILIPIVRSIQRNIVEPSGINNSALAEEKISESSRRYGVGVASHSMFTPVTQSAVAEEKRLQVDDGPRP